MNRIFITFCATIIATTNHLLAVTMAHSDCKDNKTADTCPEGCYWASEPITWTPTNTDPDIPSTGPTTGPSSDPSSNTSGSGTSENIQCWGFDEYYKTQGTCPPGGFLSGVTTQTCESCTTGNYHSGFNPDWNNSGCYECTGDLQTNKNHSKCYKHYKLTFKQTKEDCPYCKNHNCTSNNEITQTQYYEIEYDGKEQKINGCTSGESGTTNSANAEFNKNAQIPQIPASTSANTCNLNQNWVYSNITLTPGISCYDAVTAILKKNSASDITLKTVWTDPTFTIKYYTAQFKDNKIQMALATEEEVSLGTSPTFKEYKKVKIDYDDTDCGHFMGWTCDSTPKMNGCDGTTLHKPNTHIIIPQTKDTIISIYPKTMWPDNGYFCYKDKDENEIRTSCPAGMTSTFYSGNITRQSDCYIKTETDTFCDNNNKCFSLQDLGITGTYYYNK